MAKFTSNAAVPPLRVTVKVATFVPLSPSLIVTSLIETEPAIATSCRSHRDIVQAPGVWVVIGVEFQDRVAIDTDNVKSIELIARVRRIGHWP